MPRIMMRAFPFAFFCAALGACAGEDKTGVGQTPPAVAAPEAPAPAPNATGVAPELSLSEGPVFTTGGADSMMAATVGAITRVRSAEAITALATEAFKANDADGNQALSLTEFGAALEHVAMRELNVQARSAGLDDAGVKSVRRGAAFEAAARRTGGVTEDQFAAFFDLKRVEADRDFDGKLDDVEFGRFNALINGANGSN